MSQTTTDQPSPHTRLGSLKAIADYLGRSPRTVQRWLTEYGLPVHRLGGDKGPIYVYADELDGWLRNGKQIVKKKAPGIEASVLLHMPRPQRELIDYHEAFNFHASSDSMERRSAELASRAYTMWETLSVIDFSAMTQMFRDAIDLNPKNAKALAGLSLALIAGGVLGNLNARTAASSAEDALCRALAIDPESLEARCSRAWLMIAADRNWEDASVAFDEALHHLPSWGPAAAGQALLQIAEGCLAEASELLLQASIQAPLSAPTMMLRCWNEYLSGQSESALDLLTQGRAIGHSAARLGLLVQFGTHITSAAPGSAQGLSLVVPDIEAARRELAADGAAVSVVFHDRSPGAQFAQDGADGRLSGPAPDHASYGRSPRSATQTATAGCCRKSRRDCPGVSPARPRPTRLWPTWRPRCGARRPPTANTSSASGSATRAGRTGTPPTWWRSRPGPSCRADRPKEMTMAKHHKPSPTTPVSPSFSGRPWW